MAEETDQARLIAERIARRVSTTPASNLTSTSGKSEIIAEVAAVRAGMGELQKRLVQLEAKVREQSPGSGSSSFYDQTPTVAFVPLTHSPWLAGVNATAAHASEERFGIEEATINELVDYFQNEKKCSLDPSGKPCDHCAMCSSRGF
jgi:hypothetical protein